MSLVSVIIPTFNRAHCLTRALDSVAAQTFKDWELIVVDDGSTDETELLFLQWLKAQTGPQRARYVKVPNSGVSRSRNLGATLADSLWLAFLDSDDEWLPQKLERQLPLCDRYLLVHSEELWFRNGVRVNPMKKYAKSGGEIFSRCVDICCISSSTTLINNDLFSSMGGFREDFSVCEDYELWLRVSARFAVGFVNEPLIIKYGGHDDQLSRRYVAMDYFRVRALRPFLNDRGLLPKVRLHVATAMLEKADILINGYVKHGSSSGDLAEVQAWREEALSTFTQFHSAHSAAERFPRSLPNTTL